MQRPKTSQIVIDEFTKIIDSQDEKGIKKYGRNIDQAPDENYNWELMALEEAADLQKYLIKRIVELKIELENKIISNMEADNIIDKLKEENKKLKEENNILNNTLGNQLNEAWQENIKLKDENKHLKIDKNNMLDKLDPNGIYPRIIVE